MTLIFYSASLDKSALDSSLHPYNTTPECEPIEYFSTKLSISCDVSLRFSWPCSEQLCKEGRAESLEAEEILCVFGQTARGQQAGAALFEMARE